MSGADGPPATLGPRHPVSAIASVFVRLGLTAFGGPAAHIAMFREEFVRRRGWLDDRAFAELLAASNLIPGPTSTELAMHLGYRGAGWRGLLAAGLAFAGPAVAIVAVLAWVYVTWGALPEVRGILAGIAPVVVAIVAHATVGLGRSVLTTPILAAVAAGAVVASLAGVPDLVTLLAGGAVGFAAATGRRGRPHLPAAAPGIGLAAGAAATAAGVAGVVGLAGLFASFLKIGAVLFGSGYLLIALLRSEFVVGAGLLTERQLLDAVAVGQVTPGPVFTTATFVGYVLLGVPGAIAATVGMALPAFVFVALSIPLLERVQRSSAARAALTGVSAAVVGLLAAVSGALGQTAIVDPVTALLGLLAFVALERRALGPATLLAIGAVVGALRAVVGA